MNKFSVFLKKRGVKLWFILSAVLIIVLATLTPVARLVPWCYNGLNSLFGGERRVLEKGDPSDYMRYKSDYANKFEVLPAANALNERICEEGIVLLKNESNILPLASGAKISIFGKNSVNPVIGGSGSGASMSKVKYVDLYSAIESAGFVYNPELKAFYENESSGAGRPSVPSYGSVLTGFPTGETPLQSYPDRLKESYEKYDDAAVVFISRIGGEGYDLPRSMFYNGFGYTDWNGTETIPGAISKTSHYLQLDVNEADLIAEACENFDSVILVINSSAPLEAGFLDDPKHYAYNPKLKAALWIGSPGGSGLNALGRVLSGEVNPSGRTVDTWSRNFAADPTWANFGNNLSDCGNSYIYEDNPIKAYFVSYEEGIYVGYRYYETRGFTEEENGNKKWYSDNVVYPFGYGLSYTTFERYIVAVSVPDGNMLNRDDTISITVQVKNTGNCSGKDVVQLYYTPPYTSGGIEKPYVVLGDYAKTKNLAPQESTTVTLSIDLRDMASYDWSDANDNGFRGYEAEEGSYRISVAENAHDAVNGGLAYTYQVPVYGFCYPTDATTGSEIKNLFDDVSEGIGDYLSREDWAGTWPKPPTKADRAVDRDFVDSLTYVINDAIDDPWYTDVLPRQSHEIVSYDRALKLWELLNSEGKADYNDPRWEILLNQLTVKQMIELVSVGHFRTVDIPNIDKPMTTDADGPSGFAAFVYDPTIYDVCYYASQCVLASTWNTNLAREYGVMIGNESLIGNERGDGRPYSGWYAPAVNIHRSPFGGRNFEYYSEDGLLSGKTAAAVIKGVSSKGVYTYVKHFALNDQETDRDNNGVLTWANEQAMREIYFKPFEIAVKEGGTTAIMSSFNRIGITWSGGYYDLLTNLLRNEWGFRGMVITDYNASHYMNTDQMIRAGGDISLSPSKQVSSASTPTEVAALRRATKNILYTVANSNAMNGLGKGVIYRYAMPYWLIWLIVIDAAVITVSAGIGAYLWPKGGKLNTEWE